MFLGLSAELMCCDFKHVWLHFTVLSINKLRSVLDVGSDLVNKYEYKLENPRPLFNSEYELQTHVFFFFSFAYTTSPAAVMKLVVFFRSSKPTNARPLL